MKTLEELARAHYSQNDFPLLAISLEQLKQNYREFRRALPFVSDVHFALKSCCYSEVVAALHTEGSKFEVASWNELLLLDRTITNLDTSQVLFSNPVRTRDTICRALSKGVRWFVVDSVDDFLSLTLAKLKNKKPEDNFKEGDANAIDLDHLAKIVVGLKILANPDHRAGITKRDIGINPNDAKDLFNLLDKVDKTGKDPEAVTVVFTALGKLAPDLGQEATPRV